MSLSTAPKTELSSVRKPDSVDAALQRRIEETRRLLRQIDISLAVLSLGTIVFFVLFLSALADHWLFKNGMSPPVRLGVFCSLFAFCIFFVYRRIVPFFRYSINPVYAADVLERSTPSIKNALLNWILLRREKQGQTSNKLSERVFENVAQVAANRSAAISTDQAVDWRGLTRWGGIFVLQFILLIAYILFSPKNPLTSMVRVILPFSSIQAPQSLQFYDVSPGNCKLIQGEKTDVSVRIVGRGSKKDEPVYLYFSRDDGQAVEQAVPMDFDGKDPKGGESYSVSFPPGKQGFVCGTNYRFVQGDSRSETYRIDVVPIASLEIASLTYRFPDYTGLPEETVENGGNIKAVEGSDVRICVRSSLPLKQAWIVFDNEQKKSMQIVGDEQMEARTTISLQNYSDEKNRVRQFFFSAIDENGNESRPSPVFPFEVLPDRPPIVQWSDTDETLKNAAQIEIPRNGSIKLSVQAEDPDFGLRNLRLHVESGNKLIRPVELLDSPSIGPTEYQGNITKTVVFSPTESRLSVGDTAEIWVEAFDTKLPEPNVATTRRINLRVLESQRKEGKQEQKEEQTEKENQTDGAKDFQDKQDETSKKEDDSIKGDEHPNQQNQQNEQSGENSPEKDSKKGETGQETEQNQTSDAEKNNRNDSSSNEQTENQPGGQKDEQKEGNSGEKLQGGSGSGNDDSEQQKQEQSSGQNQTGQEQANQEKSSQSSTQNQQKENGGTEQRQKVADAEKDPGDAFDRIIEHMKEKGNFPPENDQENGKEDIENQTKNKEQKNNQENEQNSQKEQKKQDEKDQGPKQKKQPDKQEQQKNDSNCDDGQCDGDSQGSGNSGPKPKDKQSGSGQGGQSGETQETEENATEGGNPSEKSSDSNSSGQDGEGESTGKQDTQKRNDERNQNEGEVGQEDDKNDEQGSGGGKNRSPKKESESGSTSGGDQQGDPNSSGENKQGDDRNMDKRDIPVNPNDQAPRQRDDSLDPNTEDRRNQGGDSTDPRKTERDLPTDTLSSGEEGKGQETKQQGQSDRTQTAESGKRGDQGSEGVEQEGGTSGEGEKKEQQGSGNQSTEQTADPQGQGEQESSSGNQQNEEKPGQQQSENGPSSDSASPSGSSSNSAAKQPAGNQKDSSEPNQNESGTPIGGQGYGSFGHQETEKEAVNLEYARKTGNLVLEYLDDQLKDKPSQELLDKLGWTEEQLREYHAKWKAMAENSRQNSENESETSPQSDDDWKELLKSIGLRPGMERQDLQDSKTRYQDESKATESRRYAPPSKLRERFKNYTKGIGQ